MFARGGVTGGTARSGRTTDVTDLLRACLVLLRVPQQVDAYQFRFIKLWRVPDATARITRMVAARPDAESLANLLPRVDGVGPEKALRCRAAVASTFLGVLELARDGALTSQQVRPWRDVLARRP